MITAAEKEFIGTHAHVPEHLPGYVQAISQAEPHLLGHYLCFCGEDALIFNGYPLESSFDETVMMEAVESAVLRFKPKQVALIAPTIPKRLVPGQPRERDDYYRLDLSRVPCDAKLKNMLRRAGKELHVESGRDIREEHVRLVSEFLDARPVGGEIRYIFERIPAYVSAVSSAHVFSVRGRDGALVAFDVADFGAGEYAFYQFNFRLQKHSVPGASDLLLHEVITAAQREGKAFINLGLGISPGVAFFKEKWGGRPFLSYEYCRYTLSPPGLLDILLQQR
jgi:hypothetical protein